VRIGDRKCAGILVESSSVGERLGAIVVGIGLDVNRTDWPAELRDVATSLCEAAGVPLDRGEALVTLLASVEARVEELVRRGPDAIVAALRPHLAFVGRAVRVDGLEGMLEGLDDDGALLLRTRDALLRLRSGTLRERE
jgi:BirA family biotin operon repressor/biotin-[acetyl-CoA-carboxylase] ligase